MRNQIKLYHWQTGLYSRHKGTDGVIESLDENIDKFVEVYMGKYGRPKMNSRTNTIQIKNYLSIKNFNYKGNFWKWKNKFEKQ
jgi:hypothetical protein